MLGDASVPAFKIEAEVVAAVWLISLLVSLSFSFSISFISTSTWRELSPNNIVNNYMFAYQLQKQLRKHNNVILKQKIIASN